MSSDGDALLRAVLEDAVDDLPRLAYADWLDEHGESDRADFIRCQVQLGRIGHDPDTCRKRRCPSVVQRFSAIPSPIFAALDPAMLDTSVDGTPLAGYEAADDAFGEARFCVSQVSDGGIRFGWVATSGAELAAGEGLSDNWTNVQFDSQLSQVNPGERAMTVH